MSADQQRNSAPAPGIPEGIAKCTVTCPMCGHRHTQYRMNPHLYWFTTTELDRKPSNYQSRKSLEGYYPPLYELWHCPDCHYTAHNRIFPDPLKNVYIEKSMVRRRLAEHKTNNPGFGRVTETLGQHISFENMNFLQGIRLALLAIFFDLFITDLLKQNQAMVASSYLRLAWLYRDWPKMDAEFATNQECLNTFFETITPDWPDCPRSERDALETACKWFEDADPPDTLESVGTTLHVALIHLQMGNRKSARSHFSDCSRIALEEAEAINRRLTQDLHKAQMPEEERGRLVTRARKFRTIVDECRSFMDQIRCEETDRERERAQTLLAKNPNASSTALRELLEKEGIPPAIIQELVPERKSGGFLGGLFRS